MPEVYGCPHEKDSGVPPVEAPAYCLWHQAGIRQTHAKQGERLPAVQECQTAVSKGEENSMIVLGIDPGKVTGVCLYDTDAPKSRQLWNVEGGVEGLADWWCAAKPVFDELVIERFTLREGVHGVDLDPVEVIGWIKGAIFTKPVWQNPADAKSLITNEKLKRAGLYPPRGEVGPGHSIDALRHVLTYLIGIRHRPTIELLHPKDAD